MSLGERPRCLPGLFFITIWNKINNEKSLLKSKRRYIFVLQKSNTMTTLQEAIADAKKIMKANNLPFATIWLTGKSFGFNFDSKQIGYTVKEFGVKRTVVNIIYND